MFRFRGCFSVRVPTCLFIFTLCGRIIGAPNEPVKVTVMEEDDVILPCSLSTKENIESKLFDWRKDGQKEVFMYNAGFHYNNGRSGQDEQFEGRVSHFPDQLKYGIASIKIQNTKVADSGNYTCFFPRLQPSQIFHIELVVVGSVSEPCVTILDQTKDGVKLQCVVRGVSPKPEVEWKDSSGNVVPAKETKITERRRSYDVILQTTVTKTDRYRCVATQEEIKHQVHAETFVPVVEKSNQGPQTGWIVAAVLGFLLLLLLVLVVGGVLYVKSAYEITPKKSRWQHESGYENPPVCDHEQGIGL